VVVLVVRLEVLGQRVDAMRQDRDLYLGRTGVTLVGLVLVDNELLFFSGHGNFHLSFTMRKPSGRQVNVAKANLYPVTESASCNGYYNTNRAACKEFFEIFLK
jgi:hypothetical protein